MRYAATIILLILFPLFSSGAEGDIPNIADTVIMVDKVQVTAIKQGITLRNQPLASSVIGKKRIERLNISALKDVSSIAPNFYIPEYGSRMTSSIYVRGLGARIDQPVVGLNVDNVSFLNKDAYDFDMSDIERIEVLRAPQSTLYGRNTMGGVINVYTLSPLSYEGVRLQFGYGSGNSYNFRASSYYKTSDNFGAAISAYYSASDGFFTNQYTGEKCDWEKSGGGRFKLQWRGRNGLRIDNTTAFSSLRQGGYPYAYAGRADNTANTPTGNAVIGQINYNDPCSYNRTSVSNGLTIRYEWDRFSLSSITGYQYLNDEMTLDQDFLPASYFTLTQSRKEHALTEDIVFKSTETGKYRWLFGAFGFYRHASMQAPVTFKKDGIDNLILKHLNSEDIIGRWDSDEFLLDTRFHNPSFGAALYHESNFDAGRWHFTAGIRIDYESSRLKYQSNTDTHYTTITNYDGKEYPHHIVIDDHGTLSNSFVEVLPKLSVMLRIGKHNRSSVYASVTKGYKAGGFNTQMFSDVLQQKMMKQMGIGKLYDINDIVRYKPEKSWNYELGSHISSASGAVQADIALFYIDCRDQQLTVFPDGETTGRMMTNAGRTRSIGGEFSLQMSPFENLDINIAYGRTNAKFVDYNDGKTDYKGNYIPYAPQNTMSAGAAFTLPINLSWLHNIVFRADINGIGTIYWNESNTMNQPLYTTVNASVRFEHKNFSVDLWGRNLSGTRYDTFYFVSIGNAFLQSGRPRTFGITVNINL